MQKRSALTAALSSKPGEIPASNELAKEDTFSFPCLSPRAGTNREAADDEIADGFEKLKLSDARLLAGSASQAITLPDGSLAVSSSCAAFRSFKLRV